MSSHAVPAATARSSIAPWRLGACTFFIFAPIGVQLPFFPLWISYSGFSPSLIAILIGLSQIVRFAANLLVPPIADSSGDTRAVLMGCATIAMLALAFCGLPFGIGWIFVFTLLASAAQAPMMPLQDAIVLREVRRRAATGERPLDFGRIRSFGSASVLVLMLASGAIAAVTPPQAIIWIIAGAAALATLAVFLLMPRADITVGDAGDAMTEAPTRRGAIALVIFSGSAIQASHAMVYAFGSIGWRAEGFGDFAIGLLWATGVATEVAFLAFAHRLSRGRSLSLVFLIGGGLVALVRWLVMATQPGPVTLLLAQCLHAGSFAATYLGTVTLLSGLAGERQRARIQGWISGATSLSLAAATIVCGPLWSAYGWTGYLFVAGLAALGTGCAVAVALLDVAAQPQSAGCGGNTVDPS